MTSLSPAGVVTSLAVALACGAFVSLVYRWTYRGANYSTSFVQSLVAFAMITTVVIMVIGNNLARAFGLVGSMSIIRFRMAIKDTRDIVFIFFTLAVGMACGVGLYPVAVIATIFISAILVLLSLSGFPTPHRREYLLHFLYTSHGDDDAGYIPVLRRYCRKFKLVNIRTGGDPDTLELSYYVIPKRGGTDRDIIRALGRVEGVDSVNYFFDEQ